MNKFSSIKDRQGRILKEENEIPNCWKEHFSLILNQDSTINQEIYGILPQYVTKASLANPIEQKEIVAAIASLKHNKAAGKDGVPLEVYMALSPEITPYLTKLFQQTWDQESVPQDFRDSIIISLFKKKR